MCLCILKWYNCNKKCKNKIKYYKREMIVIKNHKTIRILLKASMF